MKLMENASRKRREIAVDLPFLWKTFKLFHQTRWLALGSNDIFPNSVHDSKDPFPTPPVASACFCWLSDPPAAARRWHRPEGAEHNTVPARTAKTPWPRLECLKEARLKKERLQERSSVFLWLLGLFTYLQHSCDIYVYILLYIYIYIQGYIMYKNCCVEYVVVFNDGEIVDIYIYMYTIKAGYGTLLFRFISCKSLNIYVCK